MNQISNWETAKPFIVRSWLKNPIFLKDLIEKLARIQFLQNNDPHDFFLILFSSK